jgi:serine/threonine protein phosphatase 1
MAAGLAWQGKPLPAESGGPRRGWRNAAPRPIFLGMFGRLFGSTARRRPGPQPPPGRRVYAVGDVHGRCDLLRQLHRLILADSHRRGDARDVVVYLGDYIDRGPDSKEVIDVLLDEPLEGFESIHLLGNHEDSLVKFLTDIAVGPSWLFHGGAQTLESYGVLPPEPLTDRLALLRAQRDLAAALPPRHLEFLRGLPLSHREGDYFFAHAGVRPGVPLDQQEPRDLLWIRYEFLDSSAPFGKIVVHGHSISAEPEIRRNRIGIDTGAYVSNRLTALVLDGTETGFIQT